MTAPAATGDVASWVAGLDWAVAVLIPVLVIQVWVTVDIWRRADLGHRGLWTLACWTLWPALIAYLALRPHRVDGTLRLVGSHRDPRSALVLAVLDHDEGRLSGAPFARALEALRDGSPPA